MASVRPAAVAGSFYPAAVQELNSLLDDCFNHSPLGPLGPVSPTADLIAALVPHAGPIYSGPCAAHVYARLDPSIRHVIIIGVNHRGFGHRAALSPWQSWRTPLGEVAVDDALNQSLEARLPWLEREPNAHLNEHSIEIQLPFLQRILSEFEFTPISLARISTDECAALGDALAEYARDHEKTLILASSDLSHYLSPRQTDHLDRLAIDQVLALNPRGLFEVTAERNIAMCGVIPTATMLFAARSLGAKHATLLKHCHSGDIAPMPKVVGYASVALSI
jgi:AmmeMemoRadiSam system protein B